MKKTKILSIIMVMAMMISLVMALGISASAAAVANGTCGESLTWTLDDAGTLTISGEGDMWNYDWGNSPFYENQSIKSVVIEDGVTSIGDYAFQSCESLTSITIPDGVTSIGGSAFEYCVSLTSITIPASVASIGDEAFYGCGSLSSITVDANNEYYSSEYGVLFNKDKTELICYPKGKTGTEYEIPASVTSIGRYAFYNCVSLTSITLPDSATSIGDYAFYCCPSLTSITIPDGVTSIGDNAFRYCTSLTSITFESATTQIYDSANTIDSGATIYGYADSTAEAYAEKYGRNFVEIVAGGECGDSVTWKLDTAGELTISGKGAMWPITATSLPWWDSSVESIKSVVVEDGVTSIEKDSFAFCSNLTDIMFNSKTTIIYDDASTIPASAKIHGYAGSTAEAYAEKYGRNFVEIVAGGKCGGNVSWELDNVGALRIFGTGNMWNFDWGNKSPFYENQSIKSVVIEDGVTSIGDNAFSGCSNLTSINIPDGVTSIGDSAFRYCDSLTSITIPDSVTSIGECAFSGCRSLESITIPDGVTSIGYAAFQSCESLTSVTIPSSVTSIGDEAFSYCSSLESITFKSATTQIYDSANTIYSGATIYGYADSTAEAYAEKYGRTFVVIGEEPVFTVVASGECGESLTWTLDDNGTLTISGTGAMANYDNYSNKAPWQDRKSSITSVVVEDGVTSIGRYAFSGCSSLTSVTIPEGVTSIGENALYGCSSLTSVTIPNSVTSIGMCAFQSCSSLTSITIPASVAVIGSNPFNLCGSLASITVDENNAYYSSLDGVLFNKDKTTLIYYPEGKTEATYTIPNGVTSIGKDAFSSCSRLTSVTIPNSVRSIGDGAFWRCISLTSIIVDESNAYYSSDDGVLFNKNKTELVCYSAGRTGTTYTIPNSVTSIAKLAFGCDNLASITFASATTEIYDSMYTIFAPATIYGYAGSTAEAYATKYGRTFVAISNVIASGECGESLTWTLDDAGTLTISGEGDMWNYDWGNSPFYQNTSIKSVVIEDGVTSIGDCAFQSCESLTSITIPSSVTSIGDSAFYWCTSLTSITIPASVTSIGWKALSYCTGLTSITVDANNEYYSSEDDVLFNKDKTELVLYPTGKAVAEYTIPSSVTSIGDYAFLKCGALTSVTIPNSVESMGSGAFEECRNLTSIVMPGSVTSIGEWAFQSCVSLTSINIPDGVTSIGNNAFSGCSSLKNITLPDSVTSIGSNAFSNCHSLTSITIPDSVTSIGYDAFEYCHSLTSITIPDSVTSIGYEAFLECNSLTSITIPDRVTSISSYTFWNCSSLTSITIPDSVTSIYNNAFSSCSKLTSITIPASVTYIGDSAFGYGTIDSGATIYGYADSTAQAYATKYGMTFVELEPEIIASGECGDNVSWELNNAGVLRIFGTGDMWNYDWNNSSPSYANQSIKSVVIEDGVTSIGEHAFNGCSSLSSITIPDGVTSISYGAFWNCSSLTSITLPDSVTSIGNSAFSGCRSLTSITVDANNKNYSSEYGVLFNKDKTELICYPKGKTGTTYTIPSSVTSIGDEAFSSCSSLTSITIPEGVTSIGEFAFSGCSSLESITFESATTQIYDSADTIDSGATIYGYADSTAQVYAEKYGINFVEITPYTISVSSADRAFVGEETEFTVDFSDFNIPAIGLSIKLTYDKDVFDYVSGEWSIEGVMYDFDGTNEKGVIAFDPAQAVDGSVLTFVLKAKTVAEATSVSCDISYQGTDAETYEVEVTAKVLDAVDYTLGDLDGDDKVTAKDAIRLLYHTFFPNESAYAVSQPCDFNGDGAVSAQDAIYLLYYVFYPEDYPLAV